MSEKINSLVVIDVIGDELVSSDFECISAATTIAEQKGGQVTVLAFVDPDTIIDAEIAPGIIAKGADKVLWASKENLAEHDLGSYVQVVSDAIKEVGPWAIIFTHNNFGGDLAPRVAFRNLAAIVTGTQAIDFDEAGEILLTRVCYGGRAEQIIRPTTSTVVVTLREKVFEPLEDSAERAGEISNLLVQPQEQRVELLEQSREEQKGVRLENANVVVSGGRGVGGPDGFEQLKKLAECLNGALGASRVACDLGWVPHSWQVGLSGKTVSPDLYFAVGISGASHHLAGCGSAKVIIAINSDRDAPIFSAAKYGVVGDYSELVPALVEEFKKSL